MNIESNKLVSLTGASDYDAVKRDGTTEPVKIRQLPIKLLPKYASAQDDELQMAEVLCDKPAGWAETLSDGSIEQIIITGEEINADFFGRWAKRRLARLERLQPGAVEKAIETAARSA